MHFLSCVIPMHCSGVALLEINEYSALEWVQAVMDGETADGNTNCMFMLTTVSIWVTSVVYFGSWSWLEKRFDSICSGWTEQCQLLNNCFMLHVSKSRFLQICLETILLKAFFFRLQQIVLKLLFFLSENQGSSSLCSFEIMMECEEH